MTTTDADRWNERYATRDFVWTTEPNRFLPPEVAGLAPDRAVDLACGEGRNAVWLAGLGWRATGVDFAGVGLAKARSLAEANGVDVAWVQADVTTWSEPEGFDLVIAFYLQVPAEARRAAFARAALDLAPGGTLLIVGPQGEPISADRHGAPRVSGTDGPSVAIDCLVRAHRPAATSGTT